MSVGRLRPVDLAREHGLSTQAVRDYEDTGILPQAERTRHGYRIYRPPHAQALRTFVALVPAQRGGLGSQGAVWRRFAPQRLAQHGVPVRRAPAPGSTGYGLP